MPGDWVLGIIVRGLLWYGVIVLGVTLLVTLAIWLLIQGVYVVYAMQRGADWLIEWTERRVPAYRRFLDRHFGP
jgi:hypothetical protein